MALPPEVDIEALDIHDSDRSTRGGPPPWIVMAIIAGVFLVAASLLAILWLGGAFTAA
ncbi:MAG: hypothetical protein RLN76_08185 [Phycisphaeraceae bacterium]